MIRNRSIGTSYTGTASGTANGQTVSGGYATWGSSTSGSITRYTW